MLELYKNTIVRIISFSLSYDWYAPFRSPFETESVGTGFFFNDNGFILTCAHCVEDSMKIEVTIPSLGKKRYKAEIISLSTDYDIAVIKINEFKNENFLKIGNSDELKQGQEVKAIGYSLGTDKVKLTKGIISGYQNHLIQTDAAINPGNSGGPLLDDNNNVVAINSQKISSGVADNVGFSIPINLFLNLESKFLNTKKLEQPVIINKPILLCSFSKIDKFIKKYYNLQDDFGIIITKIDKHSVLYKAGVRKFDILISFDRYKIDNYGETKVEWNNEKFTIADLLYRYANEKEIDIEYFNIKNGKKKIKVILDYPKFKIDFDYLTITNKKIDYEIISGLIFSNFRENHLAKDQLMGASLEKAEKLKLLKYSEYENKFENKLYLPTILAGSYIASNTDLSAGTMLEKINDIQVNNLDQFRDILLKNKREFIKLEFSSSKIVVLNRENILSEHKILSEKYMYKTSKFIESFLNIYDISYSSSIMSKSSKSTNIPKTSLIQFLNEKNLDGYESDNEVSINIPKKSNEISKKEPKQNIDNELFEELKNDLNNNSNENIFSNTLRISKDDSNIFNI